MAELKRCPSCHSVPDIIQYNSKTGLFVLCNCSFTFGPFDNEEDLVKVWNRRGK